MLRVLVPFLKGRRDSMFVRGCVVVIKNKLS
jgi:hypothetical protein